MTTAAATQFLPVVASAGAARNSLVVSVHDVAPCHRQTVEAMLARLAQLRVPVCSLLVVPDYHHNNPIAQDKAFLSWLRELRENGHEMVIHGYFHKRPQSPNDTVGDQVITRFYTQGEGEFFDLGYDEAFRRIQAAREIFEDAKLQPRGFIAPAWLLSAAGERAARDAGMEYTTRLRTVLDLRSGQSFAARSLVYSARNEWRRSVSRLWNGALHRLQRESALVRLSIHPPDYSFPAVWGQIERFLGEMAETRTPTTYQDWIAEKRLQNRN